MRAVNHPLVLILSSHVYLPVSHTLETLCSLLVEHPDACAASICREVTGANTPRSQDGDVTEHVDWKKVTHSDFVENYPFGAISNSCNMVWKENWETRHFNEEIPRCEDQEWLFSMLKRGQSAIRILSPPILYDNPYHSERKEDK
ncbi:hypothetical protein GGP79_002342 [Salinibacter ruber]|nr:hypothetical protein [Salinibacter ruber]